MCHGGLYTFGVLRVEADCGRAIVPGVVPGCIPGEEPELAWAGWVSEDDSRPMRVEDPARKLFRNSVKLLFNL